MEELRRLLEELLNERLLGIVISAPRQKESYRRIRIRALDCRGALRFQAAFWDGKKEFHKNYEKEALIPELLAWMSRDYRQLQAESTQYTASALVSKKGTVTVKKKARATEAKQADRTHNRTKRYLLAGGRAGTVPCEAWRHDAGGKGRKGEVRQIPTDQPLSASV